MRRIVVGVDGSEGSAQAVRWAATEARLHGASLVAVTAFTHTEFVGVPGATWPVRSEQELEERAVHALDAVLAEAAPDMETTRVVVYGSPSQVLVDASEDADLLVVGARGRGAIASLLLGSVSQACVLHAHCPVVVVPDAARRAGLRADHDEAESSA